jgi:hypothetical protein
MQDHGDAFGGVTEFVNVRGNRGDALHAEIPRRHVAAELFGERQHEAAHAAVDVAIGADAGGQFRNGGNRVHHALGILRRGPHHQHRVRTDLPGHGIHVGRPVVAYGCLADRQAEQVGSLVKRGMGAFRQDDLACGDAAFLAAALPGGEHSAKNGFGAAAGQKPCCRRRPVAAGPPSSPRLRTESAERRKRFGVQGVLVQIQGRGALRHFVHPGTTVSKSCRRHGLPAI